MKTLSGLIITLAFLVLIFQTRRYSVVVLLVLICSALLFLKELGGLVTQQYKTSNSTLRPTSLNTPSKITGEAAEAHYQWIDQDTGECTQLQPEFARMSLKPGIGGKWFDLYSSDVYAGHDYVVINGHKCRPPRYFDRLLEKHDPERHAELKDSRKATAARFEADNTPDRLAVKETVRAAALAQNPSRKTL